MPGIRRDTPFPPPYVKTYPAVVVVVTPPAPTTLHLLASTGVGK